MYRRPRRLVLGRDGEHSCEQVRLLVNPLENILAQEDIRVSDGKVRMVFLVVAAEWLETCQHSGLRGADLLFEQRQDICKAQITFSNRREYS